MIFHALNVFLQQSPWNSRISNDYAGVKLLWVFRIPAESNIQGFFTGVPSNPPTTLWCNSEIPETGNIPVGKETRGWVPGHLVEFQLPPDFMRNPGFVDFRGTIFGESLPPAYGKIQSNSRTCTAIIGAQYCAPKTPMRGGPVLSRIYLSKVHWKYTFWYHWCYYITGT